MANAAAAPAFAKPPVPTADTFVPQEKGWHLIDGNWYFRKSNLDLRYAQIFQGAGERDSKFHFAVDEEGVMFQDELFAHPDPDMAFIAEENEYGETEPAEVYYALPYGNLAKGWIKLDADFRQQRQGSGFHEL